MLRLIFLVSLVLMRKIRILDILHPGIFFLWMYMLFLGFSALLIPIDSYFSIYLSEHAKYALLMYPIFFIFSTHFLSNIFLLKKPKIVNPELNYDIHPMKAFYGSIILFLLSFFIFIFIYLKMGFIPLLQENAEDVRVEAKKGLGSFVLLATGMVYTSQLFFYAYLRFFTKYKRLLVYFITIISFLLILGIGYRGPAAMVFLIVIFTNFFLSDEYFKIKRIPIKFLFYGFSLIILITIMGIYRHGNELSISSFVSLFWTMTVNLFNLENIITYFQNHEYRYGMTIINDFLVAIPGIESQFFGNELKDMLSLSFKGEGVTVTAPGEGYANFGLIGVALHATIFGLIVGISFNILSRSSKVTNRLLLVILTLNFWRVAAGGFMPMFIFSLVPTLIIFYLFIILIKGGKL